MVAQSTGAVDRIGGLTSQRFNKLAVTSLGHTDRRLLQRLVIYGYDVTDTFSHIANMTRGSAYDRLTA